MAMRRFDGKVALVTGAASGIGRATALRLGGEGARLYALDIQQGPLDAVAGELKQAGAQVQTRACDVADRGQCFAAVQAAVDAFGRLDVLCNIAGIVRFSHAHETSEEEWNRVLAVNLSGPFFLSQAAIPHLLRTRGNIVNVASNAGLMGQAYTAAYCASKGGLVNLTRALAMEYMRAPIRINAVAPAGTQTNLVQQVHFQEDFDRELMARYFGMRGMSQPEEIAGAIAYLASDEARSVHGAIWSIDNGVVAG
jgi:NAD(P)-dependent dehydrogenase (short-subunit alcohol dehydrogenase family)